MQEFFIGPLSRYTYGWIALFVFACFGVYMIYRARQGKRLDKFIALGLSARVQLWCGVFCLLPVVLYSFGVLLIGG
ncbi:MAG: hypothetical protein OEZ43_11545 [Gammaproteobacteria bacterium]|nr:hypothetical protein [Gammaproteobacteria bacterium]